MTLPGQELIFAIRWQYIVRYLGQFCLIVGFLNLVPLGVALLQAETAIALSYAGLVIGLFCLGGFSRIRVRGHMQMNEAMVLAAAVFLLIPLLAAIPQVCAGIPFVDAWFETVSAVTTTGLSTQGDAASQPVTFLFARAWMQWYGGLGIVVLSVAMVVRPGMSALRLASLDSPDDLVGGTRAHAQRVLLVYLVLTGCGLLLWMMLGGRFFEGLLYILAAVSTGGFAPTPGSFADLTDLHFAWVVTLAAFAGAIPLALYQQAWQKGWRHFWQNMELRTLLSVGILMTVLLGGFFWAQGMSLPEIFTHAPLMALSAQTTSGFSSLAPGTLDAGSKMTLILAMAMGGSVGSTAGGFKLLRVLILLGMLYRCVKSLSVPPNAVVKQRLGHRRIEPNEVQDALMIILMFIGVVFVSWVSFLIYGYAPLNALFEVVSATGTVGLSSGVTKASMPVFLKLVLCADMLLGRLEFVAWMVFFYHRTWFGRKRGEQ